MDRTVDAVRKQIAAMGSDVFEIGLFQPDAEHSGGAAIMIPRSWDVDSLIRSVPCPSSFARQCAKSSRVSSFRKIGPGARKPNWVRFAKST
jgi:hypothetical protein